LRDWSSILDFIVIVSFLVGSGSRIFAFDWLSILIGFGLIVGNSTLQVGLISSG